MTEMLNKEFSRKSFVKGGGAMIVGFSLAAAGLAGNAHAAESPYASNGPGDMYQIDGWIAIHADNTASIKSGAILQGTGSDTGILMIAAEELDMDMSQVKHVLADTNVTPMSGVKAASNTIINAGPGVRAAGAHARQVLLGLASTQLGVPVSQLSVSKGVVSGGGRSVTYGALLGGKLFNVRMPATYNMVNNDPLGVFGFTGGLQAGQSPAKPVSQYSIVGKAAVPRIDIPEIVTGTHVYAQDVHVPGMLHGRIVRPRGQMVYGFGAPIVSVDERSIRHISGARVVRKGDFLGVVAPVEYDAIQAAAQLKVKWGDPPKALGGSGNEFKTMRALDSAGKTVQSYRQVSGDVNRALASAAHVVEGSYGWPTNSHAIIGVPCSVADVTPQGARIFAGTQGVYATRHLVAEAIGLPLNKVRVTSATMGGAFGYMQYQDTAVSAALMSQLVGAPVRVQLMRWDELGWNQTAPGTLLDIRAGIDGNGKLVAFDYTQFYPQYRGEANQTAAQLAGKPIGPSSIAGTHQPTAMYDIPNSRYLLKSLPLKDNWIKADWMRMGSGPHATFAGEQVIDELARAARMDPVAFRRHNVTSGVGRGPLLAVLDAVTSAAGWQPKVSASNLSDAEVVSGRGIAWNGTSAANGRNAAAVADITVSRRTGKITVKHVFQAFSAGFSVYPAGVENQIVGGVVQIISRALVEQLRYNRTNVTSSDFVSYPALRFIDAPKVTPILVQRTDVQPQGVGEPVTLVAAAAIAKALFDATGVRLRTAPLTPPRVRAALAAKGSGTPGVK
jgi:CO/xanthine dehydrogenase Mo-binding subunit